MEFSIPQSLQIEHEALHAELIEATKAGGKVGAAAKGVAEVLDPHFAKEEEFALPPLGLLPYLARGEVKPEMGPALALTDRVKIKLDELLADHKAILATLDKLVAAAEEENQLRFVEWAEKLKLHAQTEEEILYPTSVLIGEFLRPKFMGIRC